MIRASQAATLQLLAAPWSSSHRLPLTYSTQTVRKKWRRMGRSSAREGCLWQTQSKLFKPGKRLPTPAQAHSGGRTAWLGPPPTTRTGPRLSMQMHGRTGTRSGRGWRLLSTPPAGHAPPPPDMPSRIRSTPLWPLCSRRSSSSSRPG